MSAATKIDVIVKKYGLENNIVILFAGDSTQLNNFLEQSSSTLHPYTFLPLRNFFAIAGPSVPAIFLSENGILVQEYNYRSIDEKEIEYFFKWFENVLSEWTEYTAWIQPRLKAIIRKYTT